MKAFFLQTSGIVTALWALVGIAACDAGDDPSGTGGVMPSDMTGTGGTATGGTGPTDGDGGTGGGTTGAGGSTSFGGSGGGTGAVDCASFPVCDDFESGTVGQPPDAATWGTQLDYGDNGDATNVAITDTEAHSGSKSVLVQGTSGVWGITRANPGESFYLRAWLKTEDLDGGDPVLVGAGTDPADEMRLRLFDGFVTANASNGDGVAPAAATTGTCPECVMAPSDWFCVQMHVDRDAENLTISVDGMEAVNVTGNAGWSSGATWPASIDEVRIGVTALSGPGGNLYIDDVVLGSQPIGCDDL